MNVSGNIALVPYSCFNSIIHSSYTVYSVLVNGYIIIITNIGVNVVG